MFRQHFAGMEWTGPALFAMGLFALLFLLVLLRTFVVKSKRDYDPIAALPFDDSNDNASSEVKP